MDTSETYVKMRIAAIPDLGYGESLEETFRSEQYYILENDEYSVFVAPDGNWHTFHPSIPSNGEQGRTCQLERQDQLQAMLVPEPCFDWVNALTLFIGWIRKNMAEKNPKVYDSMEQLWLAFCMSEKYGKVWSGTDWIKEVTKSNL